MAENVVDALIVTLGLDSSEYQQGMEEAEHTTREFSEKAPREAERGLNMIEAKFGATFRGIFHTFIAPLTAALGTMGIFSSYTQTADRIGKTADRIGASAEDLQAFGEAAKRAGGSVEGFMASFESLNGQLQRMQAMGGKGRLTPILKQLGISATENGQVKDTFQILRELASASERLGKQKFAGLARFLGLDQGTIMLLQSGRVAMDELIARQRALGVYTKEDFEITQKFNDAISDLQQVSRSLAAVILRVIVPPIRMIAEAVTAVIKTFREHQGFIVAGLLTIAATMSGPLLKAVSSLALAMKPLLIPIAAFAALGLILDEIVTYANGGKTALEGLWSTLGTPEDFKKVGKAIVDAFSTAWDYIKKFGKDLTEFLVNAPWADTLGSLLDIFKPLKDLFDSIMKFGENILGLFNELTGDVDKTMNPKPGDGWYVLKNIVEAISLTIQAVEHMLKELFGWLDEKITQLRNFLKFGSEDVNTAKEQVLAGRDENKVIAEKAVELKKNNPALTDEQAAQKAKQQFRQEVGVQQAKNAQDRLTKQVEQDPSAAYLFGDLSTLKSEETASAPAVQNPASAQPKKGWFDSWWNSGKTETAAIPVAAVAANKPDKTEISHDNRKSISVKNETTIEQNMTFTGQADAQTVQRAARSGGEKGAETLHTAAFNSSQLN